MRFRSIPIHSIRFKLIGSLIGVSFLIGMISLLVGGNLLYRSVLDEAGNRIRQDLNVARVIYDDRVAVFRIALEIAASTTDFKQAAASADLRTVTGIIQELSGRLKLDFCGFADESGQTLIRHGDARSGKTPPTPINPFVLQALEKHTPVSGTIVLNRKQLQAEKPSLSKQATIKIDPTPQAGDPPHRQVTNGLTIGAAVPIHMAGRTVGVIYGGLLLNHDTGIVDRIGETVFKNEAYRGRNVGTATIFLKDLRIATSVKSLSGKRAIGTYASPAVAHQVLDEGIKWTDRAQVLEDWHITAYEPIIDLMGKRVGMLYVGVLEAQYADVRRKAITVFAGITLAGMITAIILGWLFTGRAMRPVSHLIRASSEISSGNFAPDIGPISRDDIGQLQKKFLMMTDALKEREERQKAESEIHLIQSEKQASVGKLAAGVAHEINNPLTAVLTFTHLILRRKDLPAEVRTDLETVATQTERVREIVKSLLDFARQTAITPEPMDINGLIEDSIRLMQNQAHIKGVTLAFKGAEGLSDFTLDRNQCQSVLINMIINALDATPADGRIDIQTRRTDTDTDNGRGVEITIADTGSGIAPDHMEKLFDPFFTTKDVGKGTGLGLAVSAGIVQRHGGTIKVKSKPGAGTTFTLWLPQDPVDLFPVSAPDQGGGV
jgi:two-component system, NtrC family, sensor kinase